MAGYFLKKKLIINTTFVLIALCCVQLPSIAHSDDLLDNFQLNDDKIMESLGYIDSANCQKNSKADPERIKKILREIGYLNEDLKKLQVELEKARAEEAKFIIQVLEALEQGKPVPQDLDAQLALVDVRLKIDDIEKEINDLKILKRNYFLELLRECGPFLF